MSFNDPSSFDEQRERFAREALDLGKSAAWQRYGALRALSLERWHAQSRGDREEYDRLTKEIEETRAHWTRSTGPPVAIDDWRKGRPESPEEP